MSLAESDDQWCRAFGATISTDDIDSLPDLLTVQTGWALVSIAIPKLRLRRGVAARRLVWIIVHWIKRDNELLMRKNVGKARQISLIADPKVV